MQKETDLNCVIDAGRIRTVILCSRTSEPLSKKIDLSGRPFDFPPNRNTFEEQSQQHGPKQKVSLIWLTKSVHGLFSVCQQNKETAYEYFCLWGLFVLAERKV